MRTSLTQELISSTIRQNLFFSTVRIETRSADSQRVGTGFLFYKYISEDTFLPFIVSNKHVVGSADEATLFFTMEDDLRGKPFVGSKFTTIVREFEAYWFGHEDPNVDVAIMPFTPIVMEAWSRAQNLHCCPLTDQMVPDYTGLLLMDAIEEVLFLGYPNGLYDLKNLTPVARRGITATPYIFDFGGQKAFLIDGSVFPGSSGSPVLAVGQGRFPPRMQRGSWRTAWRPRQIHGATLLFLGVLSRVFVRDQYSRVELVAIPTSERPLVRTQQMLDLGLAFKSQTVLETISQFIDRYGTITQFLSGRGLRQYVNP